MSTVFITGANGFVGQSCCKTFLHAGWKVIGGVRGADQAARLCQGVVPCLTGDLADSNTWSNQLPDVDAIVHLAARTHVLHEQSGQPLEEYRRTNVAATVSLLKIARDRHVRRFIYMSSIKAVGEGTDRPSLHPVALTESTDCQPSNPYGISKREAEEQVLSICATDEIESVILRTPLVYGPCVAGNMARLMKLINLGIPLPLRSIQNCRSLVYVENLANAILTAATEASAVGEIFHIADPDPVSTPDLIRQLASMMGKPARLLPCPPTLLACLGRWAGKTDEVSRLIGSLVVSTTKANSRLGWKAPFTTADGLQAMAQSFIGFKPSCSSDAPAPTTGYHGGQQILLSETSR